MPQYKLMYFNLRGRAEPIRWMFALLEQKYTDHRVDREKEWPKVKSETRYGKIPVLWVDGQPLSQSVAICRYLGRKYGYSPDDEWISAECDEVADAVHDLLTPAGKILYAKLAGQAEEAAKLANDFNNNLLTATLQELEKKLKEREWFGGSNISWTDVYVSCYLSQLPPQCQGVLPPFVKVNTLVKRVTDLPQIKKWIQERPQTAL